jgi:hypothetical protein
MVALGSAFDNSLNVFSYFIVTDAGQRFQSPSSSHETARSVYNVQSFVFAYSGFSKMDESA